MTLAELMEAAQIHTYPDWMHDVRVTPGGNSGFTPRPYQISGLNHLAANLPRMGLYDDPGTGKTLQIQGLLLWLSGLGNKSVAVMPPTLVPQFIGSFSANFQGLGQYVKVAMINGDIKTREKQIAHFNTHGWPEILVMSYRMFLGSNFDKKTVSAFKKTMKDQGIKITAKEWRRFEAGQKAIGNPYAFAPGRPVTALNLKGEALKSLGYTFLACDEAHEVKNPKSKIHQAVDAFVNPSAGDDSNGLLLATGSPVETNIEDAYGLIRLITPTRYGSMTAFEGLHVELSPYTRYRTVVGYKNLDLLYQNLYAKGRRVTKRQAFPNMPACQVAEIDVQLSKPHMALYRKLVDEQVIVLEDRLIDATQQQTLYSIMQQVLLCPNNYTDTPIKENSLLAEIDELMSDIGNRKVIIFAWFQESVKVLAAHYKKLNPVVINGQVTGKRREEAKNTFIHDKKCRVLIANPDSGGVGLDGFQHVCSYAIFADMCPHPGKFAQAVSRLDRSGQTETVNVYLLVPTGTIAVKLRNDLCRKEGAINQVVKDKKDLISEMLGVTGRVGMIQIGDDK